MNFLSIDEITQEATTLKGSGYSLKDLINDERLPIDLKYEYGKKLEDFSL